MSKFGTESWTPWCPFCVIAMQQVPQPNFVEEWTLHSFKTIEVYKHRTKNVIHYLQCHIERQSEHSATLKLCVWVWTCNELPQQWLSNPSHHLRDILAVPTATRPLPTCPTQNAKHSGKMVSNPCLEKTSTLPTHFLPTSCLVYGLPVYALWNCAWCSAKTLIQAPIMTTFTIIYALHTMRPSQIAFAAKLCCISQSVSHEICFLCIGLPVSKNTLNQTMKTTKKTTKRKSKKPTGESST